MQTRRDHRPAIRPYVPPGRRLHLVDIENLAGGSGADDATVRRTLEAYEMAADVHFRDHMIVACGRTLARSAFFSCRPGIRRLLGRGVDGADRALSNAVSPIGGAISRYHGIVIGSGDRHFARIARQFHLAHRSVEIVARPGSLSSGLDLPAYRIIPLDLATNTAE
ncbi:MAG: hypothetical protein S0880_23820 [Actinomycetota bacterium]|nr:hypothetical protein [Actinomycetota bacterium]